MGAIAEWFRVNGSLGGVGGQRDNIETNLQEEIALWTDPEYAQYKECDDLEVTIQALLETGRQRYHAYHHMVATNMATGKSPADYGSSDQDVKDLVRMPLWDQGRIYLQRKLAKDPFLGSGDKGLQGDLLENLVGVSDKLDDQLRPQQGQRLQTGIKEIDKNMLIGPAGMKWIGLLGYLGSGKSTLLKSILLAFAKQGAHILFVPREERAETAMNLLIWANAYDHGIKDLPPLPVWFCTPEAITPENQIAKDAAIEAWKALPGRIEVIEKENLTDILEHYETHKTREQYTVLAIDYVAHLKIMRERGESEQEAHKRDFEALQAFSLRENVVTITPLQANRNGYEAAKSDDGCDAGVYRDCNAVEWYSSASQGMDVVFGVWYHENFKSQNIMRLSNPKPPRSGVGFHLIDVHVDPTTRRIRPITSVEQQAVRDRESAESHRKLEERRLRRQRADQRRA